jgi:hypothetical protein
VSADEVGDFLVQIFVCAGGVAQVFFAFMPRTRQRPFQEIFHLGPALRSHRRWNGLGHLDFQYIVPLADRHLT